MNWLFHLPQPRRPLKEIDRAVPRGQLPHGYPIVEKARQSVDSTAARQAMIFQVFETPRRNAGRRLRTALGISVRAVVASPVHGGGAALSDESFSEPKARAQSLASADWIKSFQSPHSKHTSTTKLGLHKPHKARVLNKMQQVRQAEMEQRMIAKRAAAAKRGLAAHGEKASLGESKTAYAREKQMAASEFASDEAASDKSFFSESQHDKV